MLNGFLNMPWWGYIVATLAMTHVTIAAVTIYLHRHQTHRGLDLHPIPSHFFRFWLWLTTGMETKEWVAIHRKHHSRVETADDPHSPQVYGIRKVLLEGAELYREEAKNPETMEKFGKGTPDDWLERNVYTRFSSKGVAILLLIDVLLFGPIGITIWAVQMLWIPVAAAGIINGVGHYWGYRNFQSADASRNVVPWGILIGGEELHNNHHAYATSAKLSNRWYEFDIGWLYIRALEVVGLAKVKHTAPKIRYDENKMAPDEATLLAVITHRYDVLARYARSLKDTCADELARLGASGKDAWTLKAVQKWLHRDAADLGDGDLAALSEVRRSSRVLDTVYSMRQELATLWSRSNDSKEQLLERLQDWCRRAEASGIEALQKFSRKLTAYA
jgi:stearoyl-CoA desaturase (Delta-9 desaturase)